MSPKRILNVDLFVQVYRMFLWILENKNLSHIFWLTSFLYRGTKLANFSLTGFKKPGS